MINFFNSPKKRKQGSGTLIFIAFMVLAFLFIVALFQWFGSFLTRTNQIFNQGNVARLLADSAINEATAMFANEINKFPNSPDPKWVAFFKDAAAPDPVPFNAEATLQLANMKVNEGGFGLSLTEIPVTISRLKERELTDVDSRGIVQFECEIQVGKYGRKISRANEYCRYNVIPPGKLGHYTFVATDWGYLRSRWEAYTWYVLQHIVARAASIAYIKRCYKQKSDVAVDGIQYAKDIAKNIKTGFTENGVSYTGEGKVALKLSQQLEKYRQIEYTVRGVKKNEQPPNMFNLEYVLAMASAGGSLDADPKNAINNLTSVIGQADTIPIDKNSFGKYHFRDDFTEFNTFITNCSVIQDLLDGKVDPLTISGSLKDDIVAKLNEFIETDRKIWMEEKTVGGKTVNITYPLYIAGTDKGQLDSKHLQLAVAKLPTMDEIYKAIKNPGSGIKYPQMTVPAVDKQFTNGIRGVGFFHMSAQDFGLEGNPDLGTSSYNPPADEAAAKAIYDNAVSNPVEAFSKDLGAFAAFKTDWSTLTKDFTNLMGNSPNMADNPDTNTGQIEHHRTDSKISFSSIKKSDPLGENLYNQKAVGFINDKMNEIRACYKFPSLKAFGIYCAQQETATDKTFKLSGMLYVKAEDPDNNGVKIPEKYQGMGMIATNGQILIEKGCAKDGTNAGNLLLLAGKDIIIKGGSKVEASLTGNGSIKTEGGAPTIVGNLVVTDTMYDSGGQPLKGTKRDSDGALVPFPKGSEFAVDKSSEICPFKIEHDPKLAKDDDPGNKILVISPCRVAQSSERLNFW